jgi:signal transduction histidine kinase
MIVTLQLAAALSTIHERPTAAHALARHVGSEALMVFIADPDLELLVPAPGFRQTLPGGAGWRELLGRCSGPGFHRAEVEYPRAGQHVAAYAFAHPGIALVFIGGECKDRDIAPLALVMPLIASTLQAEYSAVVAEGRRKAAQEDARQSDTLARALDTARVDVERAFQQLDRQAKTLAEERARAEAATRAKDEFLAMLGHELRNPLSPIVTALQLMRLKGHTSREQDVIERQVSHLRGLVDDLLDVSRITGGRIELRKERVDVVDITARAIELASPMIEQKRQTLDIQVAAGLWVDADPARLAQVFSNLLTNAAKYSEAGTRIGLSAERSGDRVRVCVRDQGIGIEPDMLERVFELFVQQTQSAERAGGLGLGLAIVRSLTRMHGGTVRAESRGRGEGSEFVVELPAATGDRSAAPPPASSWETRDTGHDPKGDRILIVDDNQDAAELLAQLLGEIGYDVRVVNDGPTALSMADGFAPRFALLDIGLPVMDGYELGRRLRANAPEMQLVAVTGYGQASDKERSHQAGFAAHLVKPIHLARLQELLDSLRPRA